MDERERGSGLEAKSVHPDCPRDVSIQCPTVKEKKYLIFGETGKHLINFNTHLQLKNLGNLRIERNFLNLKRGHLPENYSKDHAHGETLEALP